MVYKFPKAHWMYKIYPTFHSGGEEWRRQLFGKQMRLETIARSVNDLVRDERIHLTYYKAWEVRNYAEREAILELRGNPLPSVRNPSLDSQNFLTNVLLRAAKREYENNKRDKGFETKH
ncbi:unnamed protein product [Oppiella nova]|uniref:Uncharacterized protein n=1 Tax=Oppiella nova TaxID=334625 RepID=A0A7R9LZP4_9ACAR|nr:unnamed protein product [Oppiella nova]CAG2168557.1 unnamed protein product [Oppiella nova]